ncbi:hypothetical protein GPECTOR_1g846 [Gonium pectorale]|uniref:Glycoprotein endo-alpha-1,2-mannosidase-like protein n=1 Tax=Gonium pectorale TaxID=33097 RepID=A0A150H522_GONPE|nr:hypothetical protein GPECTOR_1g846 [Gonium pectorale]|eukprot:KXZ56938.1 hypothetical protein GPECTOR_1g846 [Gonium pectorale]
MWAHWDHEVLPHWDPATAQKYPRDIRFEPPDCIHSPYYPLRGPYSSSSSELITQHLEDMAAHGIGVLVASWWGPRWRDGSHDTQLVNTDVRVEQVIRLIEATNSPVRVAFHLEPYEGRTKESVREDLEYLGGKYRDSPALLRYNGRPVYYVYDSYRLPASEWSQLLKPRDSSLSVRGTVADGFFLGLWLNQNDGEENLLPSGFEGFYTYFASDQVSYGSNPANWPRMLTWAQQHGLLFVPSIGPGYNDGKIRPWNRGATRPRDDGERYRRLWDIIRGLGLHFVSITSYNEWGEGTQIEPAVPRTAVRDCEYLDYEPNGPFLYMQITKEGSERLPPLKTSGGHAGGGGGGAGQEGKGGGGGGDGRPECKLDLGRCGR